VHPQRRRSLGSAIPVITQRLLRQAFGWRDSMRYRMLSVVVGLLPWSVLAAPDPTLMSLRQEIAALEVDHTLNLTHDQAVALLPMLQNAAAQVKARRDAMEQAKPALIATLTQARDELRSTGAISAASRQA